MRFDLTDLRLFLAVVDAGSITHGAAMAGLSLPAASERLRAMEREGGATLLERGRRGAAPTEAGEALAHHARLILRQVARMRSEIDAHGRAPRARVRMLANTAAMTEFLPGPLAAWMAAHPQADLDLSERQSPEIARAVASGLADLGVLSAGAGAEGLDLRPFAIDRLVAVFAPDDELAGRRTVEFAGIAHRRFIGLAGSALQDHIDAQARRLGVRLRFRLHLRTFDGVCRMAAAGVGLGIVPETVARRLGRGLRLASARLSDPWATRRLSVCLRRDAELSPAARALVTHLAGADTP